MTKTTEMTNMNIRVSKKLKTELQELADKKFIGNLSYMVNLICQDFIDQKRQITIGGKKEADHDQRC